jgi:hypothetical protein
MVAGIGHRNRSSITHYIKAVKVVRHPKYEDKDNDKGPVNNDYAIMTLEFHVGPEFNAIPICLPLGINPDFTGQSLTAIGWGNTRLWKILDQ